MKKLIVLLLTVSLGLLATACSVTNTKKQSAAEETTDTVSTTAETTKAEITTEAPTEEHTEKPKENEASKEISKINTDSISLGKQNALNKANSYLKYSAFSYSGLIEQLEYEGYTNEEAQYGADNCGADWNEQAAKKAKSYLKYSAFSRSDLIEQLEYEGFTHEQAEYGVEQSYDDSGKDNASSGSVDQKNALKKAQSYLKYSAFSYSGLIEQLEYEGYSTSDATYAADNCGADWNEQASKKAGSYLKYSSFSKEGLIEQLEYEGFTHEQAVYGAEQNGF